MVEILLVEDNRADQVLIREALRHAGSKSKLTVLKDGFEALTYLRTGVRDTPRRYSPLVLLDLNLPKKDGRELLCEIKSDPSLKRIPVVIFTSSASPKDVTLCYRLHANAFLTKPVDLDSFFDLIADIDRFWTKQTCLPEKERAP